jgi:gamma-glutamyltranspeptidase / glutathione hydrolase
VTTFGKQLLLALALALGAGCRTPLPPAPQQPPTSEAWLESQPPARTPAPQAQGPRGMVVSAAPLATRVGVQVLRAGGNAADAAVAVAFALAVVFPAAGNLGGGGFALVRDDTGVVQALDFREVAPAATGPDFFAGRPRASLDGHLAVGVPGSVAGLEALHQAYGSRPWAELLAPAIALAREGFEIDAHLEKQLHDAAKRLAANPASAALFLPGGRPPAESARWSDPELAQTLERLAVEGARDFYRGATAELLLAEMARGQGVVRREDLAAYRVVWRTPLRFSYRGLDGYAMPPPSSGGVVLALTAQALEGDALGALAWHGPEHVHLLAETFRRAYALRNRVLGDPAFVPGMPLDELLAPAFARRLRRDIDPAHATPSGRVPALVEGEHTTHFAVADARGMVVSLTTTLNLAFGSGVTVAGAGFLLNDEMDDFTTQPGKGNAYRLVQGAQNSVQPGKRMLSSMSPTLLLDARGEVVMALGAQGGSRITSAVFQVLSNVVDFGFDVGQAVGARRIHHQHLPDQLSVEPGALDRATWEALGRLGHVRRFAERLACSPALVKRGGVWTGAADPREGGLALEE